MKRYLLIILSIFHALFSYSQQNRALIIAISDYPQESGWNDIHSDNDLNILLPEFKRLNFEVNSLTNEQATKQNILKMLARLIDKSNIGDNICIHFSCHGQQMEDTNKDENDGLDEALIPYDAQLLYKKSEYEGNNHLRDDELNYYINTIRKRIGPTGYLFVTIDACHSGTASREEEYVEDNDAPTRGTNAIFTSNPFFITPEKKQVVKTIIHNKEIGQAPICVISACQPYQRNFETKVDNQYYGTLSYALYKVLSKQSCWNVKCHRDIEKTVRQLSIKQIPMIEYTTNEE